MNKLQRRDESYLSRLKSAASADDALWQAWVNGSWEIEG